MENQNVSVFVAFRNGVAHVLPHFATSLIRALGAEPAEYVYVPEPEVVVRPSRRMATQPILGGSSVKAGPSVTSPGKYRFGWHQPKRSWKRYRGEQFRAVA